MNPRIIILFLLLGLRAAGQEIETANKCYQDKDYKCASENYKKAIIGKKYDSKDYSLVLFRVGFAEGELNNYEEAIKYLKDAAAAKEGYGDAYWTLGGTYRKMEEFELAAESYSKAILAFANDKQSLKTVYYWRARSYMDDERYSESLADLKSAMAIDSANGSYFASAGDAAYNLALYNDATRYYQKSILLGDNDKKIMAARYYWLGRSYFKLKKYEDALTALKGAIEYDPEYKDAYWSIGANYYDQSKWTESIAAYTKAISFYKADTASLKDLYYYRGRSYSGIKDYVKAMADFDAILKIDPANRNGLWQKAFTFYYQKKYKEAIPAYGLVIERVKGEASSLDDLYYFRGYCQLQLLDSAKAKSDFLLSLANNNKLLDPNIYMGHLSFAEKRYYEAKDYYNKGISGYKADSVILSEIYFRKGFSNLILGSTYFYTAKDDLKKSLQYDSLNKEAHRYMVDVYYGETNFGLAEKELDKCIQLYKNVKDSLARLYIYRGYARSQQKKYKESLTDYEQSDNLKKHTEAETIKGMGQIAFEIKDYDKAIVLFTRLIPMYKQEQKNELMYAYYARGRSSFELKKKTAAVADLQKAVELVPNNKELGDWLVKAKELQ
jgi:tetratricopeptide (TPR) repeat protein